MPKPINGEFYTKADDALMLTTPEEWPMWPFLPVKKSIKEVGFLFGDPQPGQVIVHLGNMYSDPALHSDRKSVTYDSAEACVADGWKVD